MVALSQRTAIKEGVGDRAILVEGDMFAADFSDATVLALFLLPGNLDRLRDKFLALKPGTRIVANTFWIDGTDPDEEVKLSESECNQWCKVMLFVVPARVEGTWRFPQGELTLTQQYQMVSGTLAEGGRVTSISMGRMTGDQIAFCWWHRIHRPSPGRADRRNGHVGRPGHRLDRHAQRPVSAGTVEQATFQPKVGSPDHGRRVGFFLVIFTGARAGRNMHLLTHLEGAQ